HIAGTQVAGDLAGRLGARGFTVERVALYETKPATSFSAEAIRSLRSGSIDLVIIFSPRTAATFASLAKAHDLVQEMSRPSLVALSRNVAEAAASLPWRRVLIAAEPTMASLIERVASIAEPANASAQQARRPMPEPDADLKRSTPAPGVGES